MNTITRIEAPWQAEGEIALQELGAAKHDWAALPVRDRIRLLKACKEHVAEQAEGWAETSARRKLLALDDPRVGEEWFSGPSPVLAGINGLIDTLSTLKGKRFLNDLAIRRLASGHLSIAAMPASLLDRVLYSGLRLDVWLKPEQTRESMRAGAAKIYDTPEKERQGHVALVLGAGNVSAIPALDVLHKLFAENQVVLLKMSPVNEYLMPVFEAAFRPLIDANALRIIKGDGEVGAWACAHPLVETIHITGSDETHDRIVWGGDEAAANKAAGTPINPRPISSELGGVSPTIVIPGPWSEADLRFQAEHISLQKLQNSGFNCVAAQVLVMSSDWPQKAQFLDHLKTALRENKRAAYYPGAEERLEQFAAASGAPEALSGEPGPDILIGSLDADESLAEAEVFGPALSLHELPGRDPVDYLKAAILMCNMRLHGTLGANILIHPKTLREIGVEHFEALIAQLRYGVVGVNAWSGLAFAMAAAPWGAFPGHSLDAVGSGIGKVHNSMMLDEAERAVIWGSFRPFPRSLLEREFTLMPKPPWFPSHRNQARAAQAFTRMQAAPSLLNLLSLGWHAFRG